MTKQQKFLFLPSRSCVPCNRQCPRTQKLRDHLIGIHMRRIDDSFQGGLRHGAQDRFDLH